MTAPKADRKGPTRSRTGELRYHKYTGTPRGPVPAASERPGRARARPDTDFNLADGHGRRMLPIQYLHPSDGHVADEHGLVDLTPLAGAWSG